MPCRAGLKLEAALDHFSVDVRGLRVLDAGISTGGFADCVLQRGASSVVGVDVGYGQVRAAWSHMHASLPFEYRQRLPQRRAAHWLDLVACATLPCL